MDTTILTDERMLLNCAIQGDESAFTGIVEMYQNQVYNLCYRMLGEAGEAEDAAQESFWKAFRGLHQYDPNRSFKTWLLSIASHHCIDRIRRRRLHFRSLEELKPWEEKPDSSPGPEAITVQREKELVIEMILAQLKPPDRAAVVLRYWYDMSYEEIAETLSLTVSAVKSRLHRARRELAVHMQERPEFQTVMSGG
jgi:RNA polymerase sigma-70 factor (ECF subfamily)